MNTLNNLLGYPTDQRLLILTADQLGMCHASNMGVYQSIRQGPATGAGLMVPGPWARHAASLYRGEPVGVHLTLNAELDCYRWRPITQAPSLLDGDGGFPRTTIDLWTTPTLTKLAESAVRNLNELFYGVLMSPISAATWGLCKTVRSFLMSCLI